MQIPKLTTIADLDQDEHVRSQLIARAMMISEIYGRWTAAYNRSYSYTVEITANKERPPGVHASEVSKCLRQATYSLIGAEKKHNDTDTADVNMQRRMNLGNAVHAMLQKEFELMADWVNEVAQTKTLTYTPEVRIHPDHQALSKQYESYSSCDGIFTWWYEGVPYIRLGHEIKTKSDPQYEKLAKPDADHALQTCFYQAHLDLPLMWVHYYNKSNSNMTNTEPPYFFQFDKELWETKLRPSIEAVHAHRRSNTLPERTEGMQCGWCAYGHLCKPNFLTRQNPLSNNAVTNPGAFRTRKVMP